MKRELIMKVGTEETLNSGSGNKWNKSEVKVEKVG